MSEAFYSYKSARGLLRALLNKQQLRTIDFDWGMFQVLVPASVKQKLADCLLTVAR